MGELPSSVLIRRTRLTLVAVLVIIGSLVLVQQVISGRLADGQSTAGDEINTAGRQRMLTQRIGLYTAAVADTTGEEQALLLERLQLDSDELLTNYRDLQTGAPDRNLGGDLSIAAASILTEAPYNVGAKIEELTGLVDAIVANGGGDADDARAVRILEITADPSELGLLGGLDRFVSMLADESRSDVDRLMTFGATIATTIIAALIGVWIVSFRPLARQLRASVDGMHEAQAELEVVAHHDPLTGLPNRRSMERHVGGMGRQRVTLAMLDLDGFKQVNDSLGHPAGDALLLTVADRIRAWAEPDEFVTRLGGDEFALITDDLDHDRVRTRLAELAAEIERPIDVDGTLTAVSTSVGYQIGSATDAVDLIRDADTALYVAKDAGRGQVVRFEPRMHDERISEFAMANDLRQAAAEGEFRNHYLPVVDLDTGDICSFEALVRWDHPRLGLLGPERFLNAARRDYRVLQALHEQVTATALKDIAELRRTLNPNLRVSINVPGRLITTNLVTSLEEQLTSAELPTSALCIEINEYELVAAGLHEHLQRFRQLGIQVAIDDFGTGYCSLAHLHTLAIDVLKLDLQFVHSLSGHGGAIARAVVAMAEELGLEVIAEGVENETQRAALRELGVIKGQGTLWTRAAPVSSAVDLLLAAGALSS